MVQLFKIAVAFAAFVIPALAAPVLETSELVNGTLVERTGKEITTCYNSGLQMPRAPLITSITSFCDSLQGQVFENGRVYTQRYNYRWGRPILHVDMKAEVINGCRFVVDQNCYRLLRLSVDGCNTNGENDKQGGYLTDACGRWTIDPNA